MPGEISSTEIKGSSAPLLLSLPSQEGLGLVKDFGASEIYSKLLNMTLKAIRGRRNRLLGLKMSPCDQVHPDMKISHETVALMAGHEDEGDNRPATWERHCRDQGPSGSSSMAQLSGLRPSSNGGVVWSEATLPGVSVVMDTLRRSSRC